MLLLQFQPDVAAGIAAAAVVVAVVPSELLLFVSLTSVSVSLELGHLQYELGVPLVLRALLPLQVLDLALELRDQLRLLLGRGRLHLRDRERKL